MVNKKGWLRVVEASIAVIIVLSFIIIFSLQKTTEKEKNYTEELRVFLEEVAFNNSLREKIADYDTTKSEDDPQNNATLNMVRSFLGAKINKRLFAYEIKICLPNDHCALSPYPVGIKGDIYAVERVISDVPGNLNFNPKKIKIYLWQI